MIDLYWKEKFFQKNVEITIFIVVILHARNVIISFYFFEIKHIIYMVKNLVIVESPAKAKTIEGFLGKDYVVKSSYGHV